MTPQSNLSAMIAVFICIVTSLSLPPAHADNSSIETYDSSSGGGMINRAPLISSKIAPSDLDSISSSISNISESLNEILNEPVVDDVPDEVTAETDNMETELTPLVALPAGTAPDSEMPKNTDIVEPDISVTKPQIAAVEQVTPVQSSATETTAPAVASVQLTIKNDSDKSIQHNTIKYLKIDLDGKILADNSENWSCVEDTDKGLIWEIKSDDDTIRDKNNSYSWFEASLTDTTQGVADAGKCKGDINCDTQSYTQAVNAQNYCGYSDWRLPTREEMLSIVNFENTSSSVMINSHYFPDALPSWYWTASSNENHPEHAWYVLFRNGIAINDLKARPKHIRLVRNQTEKG